VIATSLNRSDNQISHFANADKIYKELYEGSNNLW